MPRSHQHPHLRRPSPSPPPGFNAEQAKKPIPEGTLQSKDVQKTDGAKAESSSVPAQNNADAKSSGASKVAATDDKKKEQKKLTFGQKVKKEVQHYWDGTKLLATEVRISTRLALKMAGGYELTRREHRQVGCHCFVPMLIWDFGNAN